MKRGLANESTKPGHLYKSLSRCDLRHKDAKQIIAARLQK